MTQEKLKTHTKPPETAPDSTWLFDTMQQAASYTGTPLDLMKAAKKAGCRAFKLGNRVDYLAFLQWYWKKDDVQNGLPEGFATWKEVLDSEKAKREAIKRQVDEKSVMPTADAKQQAAAAFAFLFAEVERGGREYPPAWAGLSAIEIGKRWHEFQEGLRATSKAKFDEVGE